MLLLRCNGAAAVVPLRWCCCSGVMVLPCCSGTAYPAVVVSWSFVPIASRNSLLPCNSFQVIAMLDVEEATTPPSRMREPLHSLQLLHF